MQIDEYEMKDLARKIREADPRIAPGHYVTSGTRDLLERYAMACGMASETLDKCLDADLIGLYLVGRKNADSAGRMVGKITLSKGGGPGLIDPTPAPPYVNGTPTIDGVSRAVLDAAIAGVVATIEQGDSDTVERVRDQNATMFSNLNDRLPALIQDALKTVTPTILEVRPLDAPPVLLGHVHFMTAEIIEWLTLGSHVYIHGPAGSGKTTVAMKIAEAFNLPFYMAAKVEDEFRLIGFQTLAGDIIRTPLREAWEFGGVFLFDEFDRSGSNAVTAMNSALANGLIAFPDKTIKMHKDFKCIAAGNTKLGGADHMYVAANQMDAAVIDRFEFLEFPYDEHLERAIAPDQQWCAYVQAVRAEVALRDLGKLVTPRATLKGGKAIAAGFDRTKVENATVYKGWDKEDRESVHRVVMQTLANG